MAKRTSQATRSRKSSAGRTGGRRSGPRKTTSDRIMKAAPEAIQERLEDPRLKAMLRRIKGSPIALYLAGGVGSFFLARFALRYFRNHPEISQYIRENFDTVETKLREYRDQYRADEMPRH